MSHVSECTTNVIAQRRRNSEQLFAEGQRYIPGGSSKVHAYYAPFPVYAASGSGCVVTDVDGNEYLDFLNNFTSVIHGHAFPAIVEAVTAQVARGTAFSAPVASEVELARLLVERIPTIDKIRFGNSGTESVMMAIKAARAYTGRDKIAKFEGHYHGYYDEVQVSFSSTPENWGPDDAPRSTPSSGGLPKSALENVVVLPFNDRASIEKIIARYKDELAAVIVDPLAQRMGLIQAEAGFYGFLRDVTRRHGILLIADEVISFRVDYRGSAARYGLEPDLSVFGKIIGGGFPIGATAGTNEVMSVFDPTHGKPKILSGGTFTANPVSMIAGLAAMQAMTEAEYARLDALGNRLRAEMNVLFQSRGVPGQVLGDGSLFRILTIGGELRNYRDVARDPKAKARMDQLHRALLDEGVIVGENGLGCLSTPMNETHVDQFLAAADRALSSIR